MAVGDDMDLSDDYRNGAYIPGGETYPARWAAAAAAFRAAQPPQDLAYGGHPRERLHLWPGAKGCVVFVHGGYWMEGERELWSHLAAGPLARGWGVAMPSYPLAPGARVADIVRSCARAVEAVAAAHPGPLRLTGHSAGGQIVARLGQGDVPLAARDRIAGIVPVSALARLDPLRRTDLNDTLHLDAAEAEAESPALHPPPAAPVHVWVGGAERPAFLDQSRWLADAWDVPLTGEPERHHFDVVEALADPDHPLCRLVAP